MAAEQPGVWTTLTPQVWETVVTPCDCCGQVVAKRLYTVAERRFCGPECHELYRTYVLPKLERR